jgi:hypothetical protein
MDSFEDFDINFSRIGRDIFLFKSGHPKRQVNLATITIPHSRRHIQNNRWEKATADPRIYRHLSDVTSAAHGQPHIAKQQDYETGEEV